MNSGELTVGEQNPEQPTLHRIGLDNLEQAATLTARVFPYEVGRTPREAFLASLDPKLMAETYPNNTKMEYWSLQNPAGDVIAVTGIYERKVDQHEAAWLAWTCVDPVYRGRGIGRELIQEVEAEARRRGKQFLRLFTSDHPNEQAARSLYQGAGFKVVHKDENPVKYADGVIAQTVYMEKRLEPPASLGNLEGAAREKTRGWLSLSLPPAEA